MIFLIIFLALGLRLINLSQSLWLDEAVQAITAKGPFLGIFEELLGDFHPPLYHLLLWGWVRIFGASEMSLRLPSVLFGIGCVFVMYKIAMHVHREIITIGRKDGIGAILISVFLATAPFHIYYSQEARMYSMATFFAALSMYFFIKINKSTKFRIDKSYLGYFISTSCLIYSDYYGFLILLAQIIGGLIIFRKNLSLYISTSLYFYISIFLFYLPWLPFLITQFKTGLAATSDLPVWGNLVNINFLKAIPLTLVKFAIGRITIFDKKIYALIAGVLGLVYGWLILRGLIMRKKLFNCSTAQLLIGLWLIVPISIAWLVSFFVPNYQPFRLLLVLPAFYLLLAMGISSIQSNKVAVFLSFFVIFVNLTSLFVYYKDPYFWREDWRGVAEFLKKENTPLIISSKTFDWPLVYYQQQKNLIYVTEKVGTIKTEDIARLLNKLSGFKKVYYTPYLASLYDPLNLTTKWLKLDGFVKIKEISFNQVPLWIYENRN
jgi:uncharacterized membrane protein